MSQRTSRAQSAMEFLTSYGWALLIALIVLGAISFFGVFSGDSLTPEKCVLPPQLGCKDFSVHGGQNGFVSAIILNNAGRSMLVKEASFTSDAIADQNGNPGGSCVYTSDDVFSTTTGDEVNNGDELSFSTDFCQLLDTGKDKDKFSITITYSWLDNVNDIKEFDGELFARREKG